MTKRYNIQRKSEKFETYRNRRAKTHVVSDIICEEWDINILHMCIINYSGVWPLLYISKHFSPSIIWALLKPSEYFQNKSSVEGL